MKKKKILAAALAALLTFNVVPAEYRTVFANETPAEVQTAEADTAKSAAYSVTVRSETVDKTGLWNTLMEAVSTLNKDQLDADIRFSKATRTAADEALNKARDVWQYKAATEQEVAEAEQELRTALDDLQEVYRVDIDITQANGAAVTVEASGSEYCDESKEGHVILYLPLLGKVSVTAPETDGNGQYFRSWQVEDRIMTTQTTYTFVVNGVTKLEAEYIETTDKPAPKINLSCENKYNTTTGKLSFIAKRSVASAYHVAEHGVVVTDETGWAKYKNNQNAFVKGASRTRKSVAKSKTNNGTYEARMICGKQEKWYGRSYVTYSDGTYTYTEYSQVSAYPSANTN